MEYYSHAYSFPGYFIFTCVLTAVQVADKDYS